MLQQLKRALTYTFKNTQTRLVLFLTMSVFLIILGVGITSYVISKNVLQEELAEPQYQLLQISMDYIDEMIRESDLIAVKIALQPNVYRFFTDEKQNSYENITAIYDLLTTLIHNTPYIHSIYIHDLKRDTFVSIPQGYSSSRLTFTDSQWVTIADEFGDEKMIVRKRSLPPGVRNQGSEITLFRKLMIHNEYVGIIAINLKEEELFAKLHPPQRSDLERTRFIVDTEGNLLYVTGYGGFSTEDLQAFASQEDNSWTIQHKERSYLVNQLVSPVTGWKYISLVAQDSLLHKSMQIRNAVVIVSVVALLFGVLVIIYLHSITFRPVRRMQQLFMMGKREQHDSDLVHLERLTAELHNNHAQLSTLMRQTISDASSKFLFDLYIGNMSSKREIFDKWERYFHDWNQRPLMIAMVSIDDYGEWSKRYPTNDHSLVKFALSNVLTEMFSECWRAVCADFGKDKLAVLLQPVDLTEGQAFTSAYGEQVLEVVHRLLGFTVSVGVSDVQNDVIRLKQAMIEAENALSYRLNEGYGKVILFSEVSDHEMPESQSMDMEVDELIATIQTGDAERAQSCLSGIVAEVRSQKWYPSHAITLLKMIGERLRLLHENPEPDTWYVDDPFENWHMLTLEDIERHLSKSVTRLAVRYHDLAQSKEFVLCQRMIEYMKEHLEEPIGIEQVAEAAGISVSLASQFFKKEMNQTIYGYLTMLRMDRAGELLVDSEDKISDIATQVGYQHENSFIRVFRKYKDITPGKYREIMKTRKDKDALTNRLYSDRRGIGNGS